MNSKMRFNEVENIIKTIDGWLTRYEARYLYLLAQLGPAHGVIVEIGSWKGKTTIALAHGSKAAGREQIYAIDHHEGGPDQEKFGHTEVNTEKEFRHNIALAGIEESVVPMVMKSNDAVVGWQKPIRLLWIDGDHRYEGVKNDFLMWEPHVVEGGVIAFHDTFAWDGPRRVVEEYVLRSNRFSILGFVDGITAVRKVAKLTPLKKMKNGLLLFLRRLYILGRQHTLPGAIRKCTKHAMRAIASVR